MPEDKERERADIATRFKAGNQFWKARSSHGRNPIYTDHKTLADAIQQYFEHIHQNPLIEYKPMIEQGQIGYAMVPKMQAMTITDCARYCGIDHDTWLRYKEKPDFSGVIKEAEEIIRDQKFKGAASGFFNSNIIARDLGLKEASDVNVGGQKGNPIESENKWVVEFVNADTEGK